MLSFKEYINEGKWDNAYEFRVRNFSAEKLSRSYKRKKKAFR